MVIVQARINGVKIARVEGRTPALYEEVLDLL